MPQRLRCLIIGESPGAPGSACFYDPILPSSDPVKVRRLLLRALTNDHILTAPSLEEFKAAGLVFDHAIREQIDMGLVEVDRDKAAKFESVLAASATHLLPLIEKAESVWAMGFIARNAMTGLFASIPKKRLTLTPPYKLNDKIFVSRYLTRFTNQDAANEIVRQASKFIPK
jgi:hypothetical protein